MYNSTTIGMGLGRSKPSSLLAHGLWDVTISDLLTLYISKSERLGLSETTSSILSSIILSNISERVKYEELVDNIISAILLSDASENITYSDVVDSMITYLLILSVSNACESLSTTDTVTGLLSALILSNATEVIRVNERLLFVGFEFDDLDCIIVASAYPIADIIDVNTPRVQIIELDGIGAVIIILKEAY